MIARWERENWGRRIRVPLDLTETTTAQNIAKRRTIASWGELYRVFKDDLYSFSVSKSQLRLFFLFAAVRIPIHALTRIGQGSREKSLSVAAFSSQLFFFFLFFIFFHSSFSALSLGVLCLGMHSGLDYSFGCSSRLDHLL